MTITKKDITECRKNGLIYDCNYDKNENVDNIVCSVGIVRLAQTQIQKANFLQNKI